MPVSTLPRTVAPRFLLAPLLAGLVVLAVAGAATAATIPVATTADTSAGQCTLRDAITAANTDAISGACTAGAGASDVITFGFASGTITLGSPLPPIYTPVSVQGPGSAALIVDGNNAVSIFSVGNFSGSASLSGLTIAHAHCSYGCGLDNDGTLTLDDVTLDHNVVSQTGGTNAFAEGAAIVNSASGVLTILKSTISANTASATGASSQNGASGGGIYNHGMVTLDRSTVRDNQVTGVATGLASSNVNANGAGVTNFGTLRVLRSTISGNTASGSGSVSFTSVRGGAIANANSASVNVVIDRSTISGNSSVASGAGTLAATAGGFDVRGASFAVKSSTITGNVSPVGANVVLGSVATFASTIVSNPQGGGSNCGGAATSQGFNITDDTGCGFTQASDRQSLDPLLAAALAENGGPTKTFALQAASPAIDQGLSGAGETVDQRGLTRPADLAGTANADGGDGTDTGAYEAQPAVVAVPPQGGTPPANTPPAAAPAGQTNVPAQAGPGALVATVPVISSLSLSPAAFRAKSGTTVTYVLSQAATVEFRVERAVAGRSVGGHCVKPTRANHAARHCTRYRTLPGRLTAAGTAGARSLRFNGRLAGHRLAPGRYRLRAAVAGGGRAVRVAFRVLRAA